ncbi:hypothetical protein GGR56DRAFT_7099 [Xylariaceae sp. FL0804]|nr:hypothetical protein GGR56DRAFT_7099 [Xylariaceae sp. FL0804]
MSWAESSCPGKNTVSPPAATRLLNKMGAYISVETCHGYDIYPDCNITNSQNHTLTNFTGDNWPRNVSFGGVTKGNFQGNPDIAGVGILGVFVAVTSFALAAAILDIFWQALKIFGYKTTLTEAEKLARKQAGRRKGSFSEILEALVLACSDQQVFTGAAYALTLRYAQGCLVSAYHYNIVANMLLLTCATHLMSVTIVRNYWEYPWLAFIRIVCITGVFIVTGLLFTNQNAGQQLKFPTGVPPLDETESLLFLPAACFQGAANTATATFQESTKNASAFFRGTIGRSTPRNFIQGWNLYVLTLLFYGAAILAEAVRLVRRTKNKKGWRGDLNRRFGKYLRMGSIWRSIVSAVFLLYLVAGVAIGAASTVLAAHYIFQLRAWVDRSGWIQKQYNQNPENDATTFGQLVPIFLSALIVFSFAQLISGESLGRAPRPGVPSCLILSPSRPSLVLSQSH